MSKSLTDFNILPVTLFRGLFQLSGSQPPATLKGVFRKPPVILKIVPKAGHACTYHGTGRKSTMTKSEGKPEQKFKVAFGTIFRSSNCLLRSKQKLYIYFSI